MSEGLPPRSTDPKKRQSVAFIMRRRKRGRASMANSRAPERTGNHWSQRTLHNTGSVSPAKYRWLVVLFGLLCFILPPIIAIRIYYFGDPSDSIPNIVPTVFLGFVGIAVIICGSILLAATVQLFRRILFGNNPHKKL